MGDASITFFPVGNGDISLIRLTDSTDIVIDCNVRDPNGDEACYDVHHHLLQHVKELDDIPFIDAFILTHADQDHCRGFPKIFYTGDPAKYTDKHKKAGLIRINELWFTPRLFSDYEEELCEDAATLLEEAERRMALYRSGDNFDVAGNRIRIIGYTAEADLEGLEGIISIPGQETRDFDGNSKNDCTFFIHAPFKQDTDSENGERNNTSVVLQARFTIDDEANACLVIFSGDADFAVWEKIVDVSDDDTLAWDLFLAPHHCSWTFFNVHSVSEPHEKSLEMLGKRRKGAKIIASCKPIKDDDKNPPSYAARQIYVDTVGKKNFHVTSETPSEDDPKPIVFIMSKNGPVRDDSSETSNKISSVAATRGAVGNPRTYG
jgi:beta-lactamase superfamily II metal-dependent hydrolase